MKQEIIYCKCGCGNTRNKYDSQGRIRMYIKGHLYSNLPIRKAKLRKFNCSNGYIELVKRNEFRQLEHRFVMEQCLGRRLLSTEIVHHINGNKKDNRIENLELVNPSQHIKNHWKESNFAEKRLKTLICNGNNICKNPVYGEKHPLHKLKDNDVLEIVNLLSIGIKIKDIAKKYNICEAFVYDIKNGRRKGHITGYVK